MIPPVCIIFFVHSEMAVEVETVSSVQKETNYPLPSTTILHLLSSLITIGSYRDDLEQKIRM